MGLKLTGIMLIVMGVMIAGFYWYYKDSQKQIAIMHENNAKLTVAVESQRLAIEQTQKDLKAITKEKALVEMEFSRTRKAVSDMQTKFNKVSKLLGARDLGRLAVARPNSMRKIINKGSKEMFRCFEIASGATLTEKESNAEKPSEINKSCPDIANPGYID